MTVCCGGAAILFVCEIKHNALVMFRIVFVCVRAAADFFFFPGG